MKITTISSKIRITLGATALVAASLAPSYTFAADAPESATTGQAITDTAISTKIRSKLLVDDRIKDSSVSVNTTNRVVTLTGNAATPAVKSAAESIAKMQEGVISVDNELVIAATPTVGEKTEKAEHKTGAAITDAADTTGNATNETAITTLIKTRLLAAKGVSSAGISVETTNGTATLTGHVPTAKQKARAIKVVKMTKGVKHVDSTGLAVQPE